MVDIKEGGTFLADQVEADDASPPWPPFFKSIRKMLEALGLDEAYFFARREALARGFDNPNALVLSRVQEVVVHELEVAYWQKLCDQRPDDRKDVIRRRCERAMMDAQRYYEKALAAVAREQNAIEERKLAKRRWELARQRAERRDLEAQQARLERRKEREAEAIERAAHQAAEAQLLAAEPAPLPQGSATRPWNDFAPSLFPDRDGPGAYRLRNVN